jgi:AcrR family transcriptional regulator
MSTDHAPRISARQRLLTAADELFYDEGIQTVGIDRVIERAGVAKASLYNTYGSKDELVRAYLDVRGERLLARMTAAVERADTPRERIRSVFRAQAEMIATPGYHGCAFANATTEAGPESAAAVATTAYRAQVRGIFRELAVATGAEDPDRLAAQLHLVYDGTSLSGRLDRELRDPAAAVAAAELLLEHALG